MDRKTKADVKDKIMREAKRMAGSDRLTASDIEMARRKIMKPVKKASGGSSRFSKSELKIARAKKYLKSQGITNAREEGKMPKHVREKLEQMLRSKFKDGGKVKAKPKFPNPFPKLKFKRNGIKLTPVYPKGYKPKVYKMPNLPLPKLSPEQKMMHKRMQELRKKQSLEADPSGRLQLLNNGGKVKTKKPKSRLLNPYIDFGKTKEFAKNEKAGSVVKTSRAKVGTTFGRNLDVGVTYDKNTYSKRNFKQKTKKTGVEATLAGQRGRITFSAGKQSQSNPYEGRSAGKYFNVQGRINLRKAEGGSVSRGGRAAIRGIKFTGVK